MRLWIKGQPHQPEDFFLLEKLADAQTWLSPMLDFLKFWFSEQTDWLAQTSGSTSEPKSISISKTRLRASAQATGDFFHFDSEKDGLALCISAKTIGGTMVLVRGLIFDLDVWMLEPGTNQISENDPLLNAKKWFFSLVPLQLDQFVGSRKLQEVSKNWKGFLLGGASLSEIQLSSLHVLQCPVYQSYGMTETVSHVAIRQVWNPGRVDSGSVVPYKILPGISIRQNQDQCLEINGEVTGNQWLTTRDRVALISENEFYYLGRADDMINSGGIKIDPELVKKVFQPLIFPAELEILGLHDHRLGQRLVAVVVFAAGVHPEFDWQSIVDTLKENLDSRMLPKAIYILDQWPLLPNLKRDKRNLNLLLEHKKPVWPPPQFD